MFYYFTYDKSNCLYYSFPYKTNEWLRVFDHIEVGLTYECHDHVSASMRLFPSSMIQSRSPYDQLHMSPTKTLIGTTTLLLSQLKGNNYNNQMKESYILIEFKSHQQEKGH